jgi:thiamine kinase-like enzyme
MKVTRPARQPPSLSRLVIWTRDGRGAANTGQREVLFYNEIASATPARIVPRCFEASWDEDTGAWHILLEDLTESHFFATEWPLPPTLAQCESIMEARARFHAAWWDHPRLGVDVSRWGDDVAATDRFLRSLAEQFEKFCSRFADLMPAHRRKLYERLLDRAPHLLQHDRSRKNVTLIHGDAHVWNCFLPRDSSDDVRLIDWEVWRIDAGAVDLAYMMAIHWYPDRRGQMERPLLDRYHATLLRHGVSGYDRRALDDDYRLSVLWHITTPIWQAANNMPPRVWWNNLERVLLAANDLGCSGLLA